MNRKELLQKIARQFIPNIGTILLVLALLWVRDAQALAALTAKSTTTISYQGRLANSSGTPVTSAGLGMTFRLYNTTTGGSALWTETYPGVAVNDGLFHVLLGSVTPLDASYFSTYDTLYLGIAVGTDAEMTPREQLASAPYAIQAGRALTVPDGSITTAKIADGAASSPKVSLSHDQIFGPGAVLSLTATPQPVPGLSFSVSPTTPQVLLLSVTLDAQKNTDCVTVLANTYIDNVEVGNVMTLGGASVIRSSISTVRQINLSSGSHTISIKAFCEVGSGGIIMSGQSNVSYILFSQ
jgi:hypothetical protein